MTENPIFVQYHNVTDYVTLLLLSTDSTVFIYIQTGTYEKRMDGWRWMGMESDRQTDRQTDR